MPLNLFNISQKEQTERAKFALKVVGLEDRTEHFPNPLSGGQEQQIAIERAIVTDPAIVLADEPNGDLDRKSATEIMQLLIRLDKNARRICIFKRLTCHGFVHYY